VVATSIEPTRGSAGVDVCVDDAGLVMVLCAAIIIEFSGRVGDCERRVKESALCGQSPLDRYCIRCASRFVQLYPLWVSDKVLLTADHRWPPTEVSFVD
jgi:uncharacterized protein (DUF2237 family)